MNPVIVLVGRPNVGKSTLFNRLCGTRRALVSDVPGTTRDWQEGTAYWNGREFRIIDTGGYTPGEDDVHSGVRATVERWVGEADAVLWIVDGSQGLMPVDRSLAGWMRARGSRRVFLVINKLDDSARDANVAEFYGLGFPETVAISASHGRNVHSLLEKLETLAPPSTPLPPEKDVATVAIVGRPNVGKSSLLNSLAGEDRMIVSAVPGTTRDAIDTLIERDGRKYLFIDTAGLRANKSAASEGLEGLTRIMAEKALDRAEVAVLMVDGVEGIREGDVAVGRLIEGKHRACVVGINKWDLVGDRAGASKYIRENHSDDLPFLSYAPLIFLSAKTGRHVPELLAEISKTHAAFHAVYDSEEVSDFLWKQVQTRPYSHRARKLVFHGAEQAGTAPTKIAIRCNLTDEEIHFSYRRHLENVFRKRYSLAGAPLIFQFKRGKR
jgi:GTPase